MTNHGDSVSAGARGHDGRRQQVRCTGAGHAQHEQHRCGSRFAGGAQATEADAERPEDAGLERATKAVLVAGLVGEDLVTELLGDRRRRDSQFAFQRLFA